MTPTDSLATVLGGQKLIVKKINGESEDVFIRQLPVRLFPEHLARLDDELATAELFCDKPAGWADSLAVESCEAVIVVGEELNKDFFSRWLARRKRREELKPKADPEQIAALLQVMQNRNPQLLDDLVKRASGSAITLPTSPRKQG